MRDEVTVNKDDLIFLMEAFDGLLSGNAPRLNAWLKEYGMSQEDFDAAMKKLGKAVGRDFGIL